MDKSGGRAGHYGRMRQHTNCCRQTLNDTQSQYIRLIVFPTSDLHYKNLNFLGNKQTRSWHFIKLNILIDIYIQQVLPLTKYFHLQGALASWTKQWWTKQTNIMYHYKHSWIYFSLLTKGNKNWITFPNNCRFTMIVKSCQVYCLVKYLIQCLI